MIAKPQVSETIGCQPTPHDLTARNEPPTAWLRGLGWMRMSASPGDVVLAVVPGWSPIMSLT